MWKVFGIALVFLGLSAGPAAALEIKDVRSTYGPFGGVRPGNKFLPGDMIWLAFQIHDLKQEPTTGLVKYSVKLEVFDLNGGKSKTISTRKNDQQEYLSLNKNQLSDRAQVSLGIEEAPGKYAVQVTITDLRAGKEKGGGPSKSFTFEYERLPADFGFIHTFSPAVAVAKQPNFTSFCRIVGMARGADKLPNIDVSLVIRDENGKPALPKPLVSNIPKVYGSEKDIPEGFDIKKTNNFPLPFPISLNRAGRFTIEIEAIDRISKKTAKVSFPLRVYETSDVGAK